MGQTLFDKYGTSHVIKKIDNGPEVLFIDRHMVHEVKVLLPF
jgi:3-isopropylmalate/(R)-2-methylmalate dehydratase large subunit